VYDQRPSDTDLLIPAIELHQQQFGRPPRLVTADAGFFSIHNEGAAHERGVKRIAIPHLSTKNAQRKSDASYRARCVPRRKTRRYLRIGKPRVAG